LFPEGTQDPAARAAVRAAAGTYCCQTVML
jgi:hypothetical protein